MMKKTVFLKLTISLAGLFVFITCISLPAIFESQRWLMNPDYAHIKSRLYIGLYSTLIPFYIALYQTGKLLQCIERQDAFSETAANSLNIIKNCAYAIAILYLIGLLYAALSDALQNGIALTGLVILFSSLVISIFAMVLQELVKSAIEIKSENDLTV